MTDKEKIYLHAAKGLASCQQVEFELKNYLLGATDLIRKHLDGAIPFKVSYEQFKNASLEGLIKHFRNYSDDDALISRLNKFKGKRNNLAHGALISLETPSGEFDNHEATKLHEQVNLIGDEASRLSSAIHSAAQDIWVNVWFDDISNDN